MENGRRKGRNLPIQQFRFCHVVYCLSRVRRFVSSFPQSTTFFADSLLSTSCHVQKRRISARETEPAPPKNSFFPQLFFKPFPSRKRTGEKEEKKPSASATSFQRKPRSLRKRETVFPHRADFLLPLFPPPPVATFANARGIPFPWMSNLSDKNQVTQERTGGVL